MDRVSYSLVQRIGKNSGNPYWVIRIVFGKVGGQEIAIEKFLSDAEVNMIKMIEAASSSR